MVLWLCVDGIAEDVHSWGWYLKCLVRLISVDWPDFCFEKYISFFFVISLRP